MMTPKLAAVAAAAGLLMLSAAPAASADAATHPLTKHANTCNITTSYCSIESEDSLYVLAPGNGNDGAYAHDTGSAFTWEQEDGNWGFLVNADGECEQWSNSVDQLLASATCTKGDGAQYFWPYAGAPDGSEVIKNYDEGTGPNMEIPDASGDYIQFVNGNNGGTALSWQST